MDVCCIEAAPVQDSTSVFRLIVSFNHSAKSHLRPFGDPEVMVFSFAGVTVSLSRRGEAGLRDRTQINSRSCIVILWGS